MRTGQPRRQPRRIELVEAQLWGMAMSGGELTASELEYSAAICRDGAYRNHRESSGSEVCSAAINLCSCMVLSLAGMYDRSACKL